MANNLANELHYAEENVRKSALRIPEETSAKVGASTQNVQQVAAAVPSGGLGDIRIFG